MATLSWLRNSGNYLDAYNWRDLTTGSGPPAGPPGSLDLASVLNAELAFLPDGASAAVGQAEVGGGSTLAIGAASTLDVLGGVQASPPAANPAAVLDVAPVAQLAGLVSVAGAGASLVVDGLAVVGDLGAGTLAVGAGAAVTLGGSGAGLVLGQTALSSGGEPFGQTSSGTVLVGGLGTSLAVSGALSVGEAGTGLVQVTAGARARAGAASVGSLSGIGVDGAGSDLALAGGLDVAGLLAVSNGGVVRVGQSHGQRLCDRLGRWALRAGGGRVDRVGADGCHRCGCRPDARGRRPIQCEPSQ